jgi:hypothetical protein
MSLALFVSPKWAFPDDNGGPASGWLLYTYEPGTSTNKTAYQDSAGTTPHTNPIVLDARGEAEIWLDGAYKFALKTDAGVEKWSSDNIGGSGNGVQTDFLSKSVAGGTDVALTSTEQSNSVIELTGALTGNINVTVDDTRDGWQWIVKNSTSGAFTVTFKTDSGTGIVLAKGVTYGLHCDSANVVKSWVGMTAAGTAADKYLYTTAADTWAEGSITTAGRALLDDATAASQRATLGSTTVGDAVFIAPTSAAARLATSTSSYGYIGGLIASNNGTDANNDIDISAGECIDSTNASILVGTAMTKQLDAAWAAGTNAGGLDTGTKAVSTEYYIHAILKDADSTVDYLLSTSRTAPTMPTGYTLFRNIGWCKTDGSGNILGFIAEEISGGGLNYQWKVPTQDFSLANTLTTTARTDALNVISGVKVKPITMARIYDAASTVYAMLTDPDTTDTAPSASLFTVVASANISTTTDIPGIFTNTSRHIRARASLATVDLYDAYTFGFEWSRR